MIGWSLSNQPLQLPQNQAPEEIPPASAFVRVVIDRIAEALAKAQGEGADQVQLDLSVGQERLGTFIFHRGAEGAWSWIATDGDDKQPVS